MTGRWLWAVAAAVLGAAIVLRVAPPDSADAWWYPACLIYTLTGLHCPGCGSTRALAALVRGDFTAALAANPFTAVAAPATLIWLAARAAYCRFSSGWSGISRGPSSNP